jgi:hypothetical protein
MGVSFSVRGAAARGAGSPGVAPCDFGRAGWAGWGGVAAGFAAALGGDLFDFTVTFDTGGLGLGEGRVAFLATAALRTAFLGIAFPGFFAALFGFFEGIFSLRLQTRERAIIPTLIALYRP